MAIRKAPFNPEQTTGNRAGFTLLEVMVAMAILATSMVILLESHAASVRISDAARRMSVGAALAQDLMTEFEMQGFPTTGSDSGDFEKWYPSMYPEYRWEIEVNEGSFWQYVREVYVKVIWVEGGTERHVEMANFVAAMDEEDQEIAASTSTGASSASNFFDAFSEAAANTKGGGAAAAGGF